MLRQCTPALDQIGTLPPHAANLFVAFVRPARGRVAVIQFGTRRADHPPAARAHAQAEVDIIVGDCEVLGFEPAHRVEHRAAQGHAGTSHRRDAAGVAQHPAVARIVARGAAAQMRRNAARADGDAGVLQGAIGIQ